MTMESGGSTGAAASRAVLVEPSLGNALPYFAPLLIFPLVALAALNGGWWFAGPFVFLALADKFDQMFGMQERNMDPDRTPESRLFVYKLSAWAWAVLWPVVFAFGLWQMLAAEHLAAWEIAVLALVLVLVGQTVFVVGHELVHRRSSWERHVGEFLLASASYPHYATEHVYIHHPMVCTPADPGSAPRGMSFWRYLPREIASNLTGAWRFEKKRLARSRLPVWHYSNPFWRYALFAGAWYALIYVLGGVWAVVIYAVACSSVVFSMKISNYVQHYGLRRVRLPSGRFERVLPRHAWSADYKFTNWLYYNMQRHADHHAASNRRYPLLQHYGKEDSPQLPDRYSQMNGLALFPSRWFKLMDPLLDRQRAFFYPEIKDWRPYDSAAFAARPEAFDSIAEVIGGAPRLAAWMNRAPELLDSLRTREFTDLDLPDGFGVDAEFERIARRGLVRLYWTHELGVEEMKEQLAATHTQNAGEAVGVAREWSNGKLFQIGVHTMRGNLTPAEAGAVASRVAEASISTVLSAVCEDFAERRSPDPGSSVCAVVFGDLASGDRFLGAELDILFLYEGGPPEYFDALYHGSRNALRALSRDNLLLAPMPRVPPLHRVRAFSGFRDYHRDVGPGEELLQMTRARCVFASGRSDLAARFEALRREILAESPARRTMMSHLAQEAFGAAEPGLMSLDDMQGGFRDVERAARYLQLKHAGPETDLFALDAGSVLEAAADHGFVPDGSGQRLAATAKAWRNLRCILRLVLEDGSTAEEAPDEVKAAIAAAGQAEDFDALTARIPETAVRAAADIGAIEGMTPPLPLGAGADADAASSETHH
ncbi:MAG: fatty acid desaturase [Acidobacteriota bacterium]|nr:fatty acid desaturase [Acidobacteriota bacterium]